jgi:cell division control protein 42
MSSSSSSTSPSSSSVLTGSSSTGGTGGVIATTTTTTVTQPSSSQQQQHHHQHHQHQIHQQQQQQQQQNLIQQIPQAQHYIKCVAIGDGAVGKTCMLHTYTTNKFPWDYEPTVFDNYAVTVHIGKQAITLGLFDTAGQEDWDKLRIMSYTATDVFIVCFSVMEPSSFLNVEEKWIPEIKQYMPNVPFVLVGTQIDLRDNLISLKDLTRKNQKPISKEEGEKLARKVGARAYIECSALLNINVKQVFDTAIITYFQPSKPKKSRFKKLLCGWSRASELMN